MRERLLLISPVKNEGAHIERVVRAVGAQTRPPDTWLIVDDGSQDETLPALRALEEELPFVRVLVAPQLPHTAGTDLLSVGAPARAFNFALDNVSWREFTHIGKLDGDVELPPDYFAGLLEEFERDPSLGIGGGNLAELFGSRWKRIAIPSHHVHGAVKLYSRPCFEAIGGIQDRLAWDGIDETYARMRGFATRSFPEITARHLRHSASAQGVVRGRARHGECAYILRYSFPWVVLRSGKVAMSRPIGLSGLAFLYGYVSAAVRSVPKVEDDEFRRFVRRELRQRLKRPLALRSA